MKTTTTMSLLLLPTMIVIGNSMYIPLIPLIQTEYQLTQSEGAWFLSLFTLAGVVFIPLGQCLARWKNPKFSMLVSCCLVLIGATISMLELINPSLLLLIAGRLLMGAGAGSATALAYAYAAVHVKPIEKRRLFGQLERSNGLAKMISPLLGSLLLYSSWTYGPLALAGIAALSFFCIAQMGDTDGESSSPKKGSNKHVIKTERIVSDYAFSLVHLFLLYGLLFYASYVFSESFLTPALKGMLLALPFVAMSITAMLSGRMAIKSPVQLRVVLMGCLLLASALLLVVQSTSVLLGLVLCLIGASTGLALPLASLSLGDIPDVHVRTRVLAGLTMARFLGIAGAPILYGRWMQTEGLIEWLGLLVVTVACFLVFLPNFKRKIQTITQN